MLAVVFLLLYKKNEITLQGGGGRGNNTHTNEQRLELSTTRRLSGTERRDTQQDELKCARAVCRFGG